MQVLTVCHYDGEWAVRDVTGETYGRSADIRETYEMAQLLARRITAQIEFSQEAESHYKAVLSGHSIDTPRQSAPKSSPRLRALVARFMGRHRG